MIKNAQIGDCNSAFTPPQEIRPQTTNVVTLLDVQRAIQPRHHIKVNANKPYGNVSVYKRPLPGPMPISSSEVYPTIRTSNYKVFLRTLSFAHLVEKFPD